MHIHSDVHSVLKLEPWMVCVERLCGKGDLRSHEEWGPAQMSLTP